MTQKLLHAALTEKIIHAFYAVYNTLGYGFLEKVYENALMLELRKHGLQVQQQVPIRVYYEGQPVGEFFADLLVEGKVILELKAAEAIAPEYCTLCNFCVYQCPDFAIEIRRKEEKK